MDTRARRRGLLLKLGVAALALVAGVGCSPLYVLRSGYEEARILWRRQPIEHLLQQPDLDADTKRKLTLVLDVREFARDALHLRVGGSFASLAQVGADQVVHVVIAAHRDRLQLLTWWFPIVGSVPYRGYFDEAAARAEAARLDSQGYDTIVQPSVAFSTLGWFDDPLLSNLLRHDEVSLAGVVLHELTHNTRYIAGHSDFNESFANFVGYCGAVAFFESRADSANAARAHQLWHDGLLFSAFLGGAVERLTLAYADGITDADRQHLFGTVQAEYRALPQETELHASFGRGTLNNARILHHLLYDDRLAVFEAAQARFGGRLGETIAAVLAAAEGAADPFAAVAEKFGSSAPELAAR